MAKIENNNVYYYHNDHLGTPMLMTDSSGQSVWQGEFKPFGESLSITGSITNNLRFPGQYYDSETGLHQNWWRDYRPDTGSYVEVDPIGLEGGINLFVYVGNNPVNDLDLQGLFSCRDNGTVDPKGVPHSPNEGAAAWAQYQYEIDNKDYTNPSGEEGMGVYNRKYE